MSLFFVQFYFGILFSDREFRDAQQLPSRFQHYARDTDLHEICADRQTNEFATPSINLSQLSSSKILFAEHCSMHSAGNGHPAKTC